MISFDEFVTDAGAGRPPIPAGGDGKQSGLLNARAMRIKRIIDVALALLLLLFALPFGLLIALAIVLDTRGPVFFHHSRVGLGNRRFNLWKFRSMVRDADSVLDEHLKNHPELQLEWNRSRKLKADPRVTRIGRLLRRSSLDELPQLWSVLRGDMSMIGPRPIVEDEIARYGDSFYLLTRVKPGLTGLWQVSGRSDIRYSERVDLDCRYISEWTPAMDFAVLLKTVRVVLLGHGAY
jgi:Undecaprenyl-phosphate galactose phosphotransferase WbaP